MPQKNINSRITLKHDIEENWNKATGFTPWLGEMIIYDPDASHAYSRIKIGDGKTNVIALPFSTNLEIITDAQIEAICV